MHPGSSAILLLAFHNSTTGLFPTLAMSGPEQPALTDPIDAVSSGAPDDDAEGPKGDEAYLGLPAGLDERPYEDDESVPDDSTPAEQAAPGLVDDEAAPDGEAIDETTVWLDVTGVLAGLDAITQADDGELDGIDDPSLLADSPLGYGNEEETNGERDAALDLLGELELEGEETPPSPGNDRDIGPLERESFVELVETGAPHGRPWRPLDGRGPSDATFAVSVAEAQLFVAGYSLWHRDSEGLWCEHPRSEWGPVTTIVGVAAGSALAATRLGCVLGVERRKGGLHATTTSRFSVPDRGEKPVIASFNRGRRALFTGQSVFALDPEGRIESEFLLAGTPLAIASSDERLYVLASAERGARLHELDAALESWNERALFGPAAETATRGGALLSASGSVVAVADFRVGVVVSADRGDSFTTIAGSATCTALTAGSYRGKPSVWAALFSELRAHASLLLIDAASGAAETIAELEARSGRDDDGPRVHALAYDDSSETLYVAGEHGLYAFRAPAAGAETR